MNSKLTVRLALASALVATAAQASNDANLNVVPQALDPLGATAITVNASFTGTEATQDGRIFRDGVASTCNPAKAHPGITGVGTQHAFQTFTFFNNLSTCITVNFDPNPGTGNDCGVGAHLSAYLGSYDPNNQAANYLGDVGSSTTQPFSFAAPAGSTIVLVASSNAAAPLTCNFNLSSNELSVAAIPTLSPMALTGLALVLGLFGVAYTQRYLRRS